MSEPVMQLRDVSFAYHHGERVVEQITADVEPGRMTAVIGPNAAGKTTLLKLMLGMLSPTKGAVMLGGKQLRSVSAAQRAAQMSYVPQRSSANFAFSVEHVVAMGRFALPWDAQAMSHAMRSCDLEKLRGKPFAELSAGQQQRVLLARAMCQAGIIIEAKTAVTAKATEYEERQSPLPGAQGQGRIMLLDEPTSAMDLHHIHQTMDRLAKLRDAGLAVVVVMHDLNLAARYADAVWLMQDGRLAAAGHWADVLKPELLGPVYGVEITRLTAGGGDGRPVFDARLADAANAE